MSAKLQTILVPRDRFTLKSAKYWVKSHGYKVVKVDTTERFYRFRQRKPASDVKYFTIRNTNGVELVFFK